MSDYNLGTARGVIEIEYKGDGAKRAREDLNQTSTSSQKSGFSMDRTARKAGIAGAVIAGGFAIAAKTAADFEESLSKVEAVSGANGKQMDLLRDKALQLGKDTAFSAGESAAAMEELAKAGLSVGDILSGAADATVALAAAGSVDMPTAAGIATAAMNAYSLSGDQAVKVADLMAGAANRSATDVQGIGEAFKYVAPLAANTGISIEDTTTAIAALAKQGIQGSMAGTTLRGMLQNLNPASASAAKEMRKLGIITKDGSNQFFDAQGNTKSMAEISEVLSKSLNHLSDKQKSQALSTIFGARAMTGALALAKQGKKGFNDLGAAIGKVSAEQVAATKMDNLKGSLEQLSGTMETIGITIGSFLIPALTGAANALLGFLNHFLTLPKGAQVAIAAFIGLVGASLLALAAFVKIVKGVQAVRLAFIAFRATAISTWLAALGPISLIIIAVAAVIAIIVLLWKKSETFRSIVLGVWAAIKAAAQAVASWFAGPFVSFFMSAWNAIKGGLSAVKGVFTAVWSAIVAVVRTYISVVATIIRTYIAIWRAIITGALAVIMGVWRAFWGLFGGVIRAAFGLIVAIVKLYWVIIKGLFILYLRLLLAVARTVWNAIVAVIRTVWNVIKAVVQAGVSLVKSIVTSAFNAIRAVTSAVWNGIKAVLSAVWGAIGGTVTSGVNRVKSAVTTAWNAVKSVTSSVWNALKGIVSGAINGVMGIVNGIKGRVLGALSGASTWLYDAGRKIITGLLHGIESMIGAVTDKMHAVTDKISGFLPGSPVDEGPLKVLNRGYAGRKIIEMVAEGIGDMARPLERTVESVMAVPALTGDLGRIHVAAQTTPANYAGSLSPSRRGSSGTGTTPGRSKLIEGTLKIDKSGRAFIRGMAEDVVDSEDRFAGAYGRMN